MLVQAHNSKKAAGSDDAKERVQSMQSYGMQDWESWKDYVAQSACLMPHRSHDLYESESPSNTVMVVSMTTRSKNNVLLRLDLQHLPKL